MFITLSLLSAKLWPLFADSISTAVLAIAGLALGLALVIVIVFHFFSVETDEREEQLLEILPGANCGGCGYSGCQGYASALASGKDKTFNRCTAGGAETAAQVAAFFGQAPAAYVPKVALVHCQGSNEHVRVLYQYGGSDSCATANGLYGGPWSCSHGCLGFGDCVRACEYGAIQVDHGVARVNSEKCIACGACVRACPRQIIKIEPKYTDLYVNRCANPDPGAKVRKVCNIGCIGCGLCVKNCPAQAISLKEKLAVIDTELCTHCGKCASVCPAKSITVGL